MNYYLDTEFHEYQRKFWFHKPARTIELISIGIVAEDGREYYAISKDFDLKDAWSSWQHGAEKRDNGMTRVDVKVYWLRDNVLKPIWKELKGKEYGGSIERCFSYNNLKWLLNEYGKSNSTIAEEIIEFTHKEVFDNFKGAEKEFHIRTKEYGWNLKVPIEFYAYYADYDWVVFCWLFGRMIDLPKGFPMYCIDLKQISDELYRTKKKSYFEDNEEKANKSAAFLNSMSDHLDYPKQTNEHNALADAKWNLRLHKFLTHI